MSFPNLLCSSAPTFGLATSLKPTQDECEPYNHQTRATCVRLNQVGQTEQKTLLRTKEQTEKYCSSRNEPKNEHMKLVPKPLAPGHQTTIETGSCMLTGPHDGSILFRSYWAPYATLTPWWPCGSNSHEGRGNPLPTGKVQ